VTARHHSRRRLLPPQSLDSRAFARIRSFVRSFVVRSSSSFHRSFVVVSLLFVVVRCRSLSLLVLLSLFVGVGVVVSGTVASVLFSTPSAALVDV